MMSNEQQAWMMIKWDELGDGKVSDEILRKWQDEWFQNRQNVIIMCMIDIHQDEMYRRGVCEHQDKYSRRNHGEHHMKDNINSK